MIQALRDIRPAMIGLGKLLAYQEGWHTYFDPSTKGLIRSFAAVIWSIPIYLLFHFSANHFLAGLPAEQAQNVDPLTPLDGIITYVRIWFVFPIVAYLTSRLLGLSANVIPWITVHNWTVFALLHFTGSVWVLHTAGLIDTTALMVFNGMFYSVFRLFVHYRVAEGTLGCHWSTAIAAAGIPLAIDWLLIQLI